MLHIRRRASTSARSGVQGQRRELIAADYAYSLKRLADPRNSFALAVPGRRQDRRARRVVARRRSTAGSSTTTLPCAGLEVVRPVHAAHSPDGNGLQFQLHPRNARDVGGCPRGDRSLSRGHETRTRSAPARTFSRAGCARPKIVLEANPDYRGVIWDFKGSDDPRDEAAVAAMKGKRIPQIGRVEISIIDRGAVALARFRARRDRLYRPFRLVRANRDSGQPARPVVCRARHRARSQRRGRDHLLRARHPGPCRRRFRRRENRAAPRHPARLRHRPGDPGHPQGPGAGNAEPDSAGGRRP